MKKNIKPQTSESNPSSPAAGAGFFGNWFGSMAALLATGVVAAGFLPAGKPTAPAALATLAILGICGLRYLYRRHAARPCSSPLAGELEGPLLLLVLAWQIFLANGKEMPFLLYVPTLVLAGAVSRQTRPVALICLAFFLVLALGPSALGAPAPPPARLIDVPFFLAAGLLLRLLPANRQYRQEREGEFSPAAHLARARHDLVRVHGIEAPESSLPETIQALDARMDGAGFSRQTVDRLNATFELQLEMLRLSLELTTVAVLWPSPDGREMRLRWLSTSRTDLDRGPYPPNRGLLGAITDDHPEAELVPSSPAHPPIPYYLNQQDIGAALLMRLPADEEGGASEDRRHGLLCVDRETPGPWSDREKEILRLAARKIGMEVASSRLLLTLDRDRTAIHRLSLALRELNSGLGIDSVLAATVKAVKSQIPVDLVAVSLLAGEEHRLAVAEGRNVADLVGKKFSLTHGLVGQAIRAGAVLPAGGRYPKPAPIFSPERTFAEFGSLLIFPLQVEGNKPLGALVTASVAPGLFTKSRREIIELITTQVAIKIELAQAHDRLGQLATTDGLTGLANHRTFQHGFEVMLQRAKRNRTPLCLLMGDLDHFKQINDRHGHPFGDMVLREVAKIMTETVRAVDLAARYGGEEFALVLENCDATGGLQLAERIRESISALALDCGGEEAVRPTISMGLAVFPGDGAEKDLLVERADQALYRAKKRGRNRTVLWLPADED